MNRSAITRAASRHAGRWLPLLCAALVACSEDGPTQPAAGDPPAAVASDFSLPDVNPTSPRFNQGVSPRDYLERVSAWYFGHAT